MGRVGGSGFINGIGTSVQCCELKEPVNCYSRLKYYRCTLHMDKCDLCQTIQNTAHIPGKISCVISFNLKCVEQDKIHHAHLLKKENIWSSDPFLLVSSTQTTPLAVKDKDGRVITCRRLSYIHNCYHAT